MLHAVEVDHFGDHDVSVAYVAATPTIKLNKIYMKKQAEVFLDGGKVPEDFIGGKVERGRIQGISWRKGNFEWRRGEASCRHCRIIMSCGALNR